MSKQTVTARPPEGADKNTAAPRLVLRDVDFEYAPGVPVIQGLDLTVQPGEIVGIIGPSGCGKSSLLKIVAGLQHPTHGTVSPNYPGTGHGCSMVFQEDTLLPWLKVEDNVLLYNRFNRSNHAVAKTRAAELLNMVGLRGKERVWPGQLSGGMKRRVAVLTAIAASPQLLLLDEPFSALDEPTRIGVHRDVYALIHQIEASAVLVTHDLAEAISMSDRVLLMSNPPAKVIKEFVMPFGKDRDVSSIRTDDRFLKIYGELWAHLSAQIRTSANPEF